MKEWLVLAERYLKSMSLSDGRRQHHVAESGLRGRLISSTEIANKRRFHVARRSRLTRRCLLARPRWYLKLKRARVLLVQVERRRRSTVVCCLLLLLLLLLLWRLMLVLKHVWVRHVESWRRATDFLLFKLSIFNQSNRTELITRRVLRHFFVVVVKVQVIFRDKHQQAVFFY